MVTQLLLHGGHGGAEALARDLDREWAQRLPGPTEILELTSLGWGTVPPARVLLRLRRYMAARRPEILLLHSALPSIYGRLAVLGLRPRPRCFSVLHSATDDFENTKLWAAERCLQRLTTGVVAVSPEKEHEYLQYFPRSQTTCIPNGIDLKKFGRRPTYRDKPLELVAVSRIHPQKDLLTMVRGFHLSGRLSELGANLSIVGPISDEEYAADLQSLIRELGLANRVRLVGPSDDIPRLMAESDVLVHSAVREAHPITIIEAAAVGTPVVGPRIDAVEAITGASPQLFTPGDVRDLSRALDVVAVEYTAAVERAMRLAEPIRAKFSIERVSDGYLEIMGLS